jgi:hypothetical protein
MRKLAVGFALLLAGCASGSERWINSKSETLDVEGIPFRVVWLRTADGIDAHSNNNQLAFRNADILVDKRQATEAMTIVARRECAGNAVITAEARIELSFTASFKCAPDDLPDRPKTKRR